MCAYQQNSHKRMIYLTKAKLVSNIFNILWGEKMLHATVIKKHADSVSDSLHCYVINWQAVTIRGEQWTRSNKSCSMKSPR